jgi:hypothetical protein
LQSKQAALQSKDALIGAEVDIIGAKDAQPLIVSYRFIRRLQSKSLRRDGAPVVASSAQHSSGWAASTSSLADAFTAAADACLSIFVEVLGNELMWAVPLLSKLISPIRLPPYWQTFVMFVEYVMVTRQAIRFNSCH